MARPLRIQYPGAVYHITCRGNERKDIFKDDVDRKTFLKILSESGKIYSIKIYAYVLMSNHFHLHIKTSLGNLSEFMRHFNITYTSHYNRRHKRTGHLYQGRYKSILVDKDVYLSVLSRYIHLNPVKVKGIKGMEEKEKLRYLKSYNWSSLPGYINRRAKQQFVDYALVLEEYGGDNEKGRKAYKELLSLDLASKLEIKEKILGQSILGSEKFIDWLKKNILKEDKDRRERPALREIQTYKAEDEIIKAVKSVTGKGLKEIKTEKGYIRYIVMDLFYRVGGIKGVEIGKILGVDYSTVSQGRKRLREKLLKDKKLKQLIDRIEQKLSR
jgi:REP element-mobilizing transposase RayT